MTRMVDSWQSTARCVLLSAMVALALTAMLAPTVGAVGERAVAELYNSDNELVGLAFFEQVSESTVRITGPVEGLSSGPHGVHIHETGTCEPPDFTSAGGHFNPTGAEHGLDNPNGPHAGDLPNLNAPGDGRTWLEYETDRISLTEGPASLFDEDGSAIVIHAGKDDQQTNPSGASGDRVACGEIRQAESVKSPPSGGSEDGDKTTSERGESGSSESAASGLALGIPELAVVALVGVGLFFLARIVL
ncbi:MAG: superoxide dismutase family protein [Candidatus Bipolaricaulia bacterium]